MAKSKFYGVKGESPRVFDNWTECEAFVKGKSVPFKSFLTLNEAQIFAGIASAPQVALPGFLAYVDGSYMNKSKYGAWAWVLLENGKEIGSNYGKTPQEALSRNIDGELYAAVDAIRFAIAQNIKALTICHDYEGIEAWATGRWKAKSEIAISYIAVIQSLIPKIRLKFKKIAAHTGDPWNEKVDQLAKKALD